MNEQTSLPTVSVLLTSYNHADFLAKSIDSILAQTFEDFELIISDDCSSDASWEVINSYKDSRIVAVRNLQNLAFPISEELIQRMQGKYVAIAHCDDSWAPDKLEKQVAFLENNPEYDLCFTRVRLIDEKDNEFFDEKSFFTTAFTAENRSRQEWLAYMFPGRCPFCHPSLLIRKDLYFSEGMFTKGLFSVPDYYNWVKLAFNHNIYIYPEKLTCFRVRQKQANTSGETAENRKRQLYELWQVLQLYRTIKTADSLISIFPTAEQYKIDGEMQVDFALARIFIDEGPERMHTLTGLDLLFALMNDPQKAAEIDRLYNYTYKNFYRETAQHDVFGYLHENNFQESGLYIDMGSGFSDENCIRIRNYVTMGGEFNVKFSLDAGKPFVSLRFDPDEGRFRKYQITRVAIDGKEVPFTAAGSTSADGWDYFYTTTDPCYLLDYSGNSATTVEISGNTFVLSSWEVGQSFHQRMQKNQIEINRLENENDNKLRQIYLYEDQLSHSSSHIHLLNQNISEMDQRLESSRRAMEHKEEQLAQMATLLDLANVSSEENIAKNRELSTHIANRRGYFQKNKIRTAVAALLGKPLL